MHKRLLLSIFNRKRIITWNNKEYVNLKLFDYIISFKKKKQLFLIEPTAHVIRVGDHT